MPTYDYHCEACGHQLEMFQSISESPKRKCPRCGRSKLKRRIGAGAGIIFKGSGFYQTDYRSDSYKQAADSDKPASEPAKDDAKPKGEAKKKKKQTDGE
jgi:putative FmdB family regulatory protein